MVLLSLESNSLYQERGADLPATHFEPADCMPDLLPHKLVPDPADSLQVSGGRRIVSDFLTDA